MNFITFEELSGCIYNNISKVPKSVDLVVGIPRSGTLAGSIIALYLNLPYVDIDTFINQGNIRSGNTRKCKNWIKTVKESKHVLIVDDSISSGKAMKEVKNELKDTNISTKASFLAVYALKVSSILVDIYFEICEQPRLFEWNYMHHWALEYTCMDIDGVLCEEPKLMQNDDGNRYREFLQNATPKIIPTKKVGKLITGRAEKYRPETEKWLRKNGVEYEALYMLPALSQCDGRNNFDHAKFKADIYKKSDYILFIESNYEQAVDICRYSHKPVFCVENKKIIYDRNLVANLGCIKNDWKITIKRVIKKLLKKINYVE